MSDRDPRNVSSQFVIPGKLVDAIPYGTGHINDTFLVTYENNGAPAKYIFQRINTSIFKQPEALMQNFLAVTKHIAGKIAEEKKLHPDTRRRTLEVMRSSAGEPFARDAEGNFWRSYVFVDEARTFDIIETPEQAYQAAAAFGGFQNDLADLPTRLVETIPDFHNTPKRLEALKRAADADVKGRKKDVAPELDFVFARAAECSKLVDLQAKGELIERTTHNDTKLNNVLIDDVTGKGICVIDLDTAMPGLPHYDFGDMVRSGTNPASEDTKELDKVFMRFDIFEALLRGFLSTAGKFLNPLEKSLLPFAGKLITLEIGIRFLTDYLEGDVYFKTKRPEHNLDRCRTQFKLVKSIEENNDAMMKLVDSIR